MTSAASDESALNIDDPTTDPFAGAAAADIAELTAVARHDVASVLGSGWGAGAGAVRPRAS